ncbi:hypothetical protein SJ05684_c10080 [Sinorhizobium sojae CCBAU 05684]|uniref:Uncharacterized protein n=1 Tax=Sinorhizobium sojae CCBAU 05684 TaxID=716928 RepID=A0A249P9C7_9HYPH|nr:hypothetical protein [Sinorhizobium sojae]ASY62466.1 hypothetical protein SJ05684_c10080 [Sinorhizobium sojae CCBAU 05684]
MIERVNIEGQWREITLEEWHADVEKWDEDRRRSILFYAAMGFRLQGFVAGVIACAVALYFL